MHRSRRSAILMLRPLPYGGPVMSSVGHLALVNIERGGMNLMLRKTGLLLITIALCFASSAYAQKRGASTPEERRRAVEMVTFLEKNPLLKEAKDYRAALLYFLAEVPDISVKLCSNVLGESKRIKGDYESELIGQLAFSQAKFIIENPDKAKDDSAVYLSGVEGVLRTWEAIKAKKPKAKFPLMEELLQKQQAGSLAEYVKTNMAGCK
jgi:hypothetical protein